MEIKQETMIGYLQGMMDSFKEQEAKFGMNEYLDHKLDAMIACKEMVEALIGQPVNLQLDGKVTVGF